MKMIIGGVKTDAADGSVIDAISPVTGEVLDQFPAATKEDVERCLVIARRGFGRWRNVPLVARAAVLETAVEAIARNSEDLARLMCLEMGRPIMEARYEMTSVVRLMKDFIEFGKHMSGKSYQDPNAAGLAGSLAFTVREPLGVVACIAPFNYPVETLTFKLAPALLMGNAIVVKAPSDVALSVIRFVEVLLDAGVPGDVLQVLTGSGAKIGDMLVDTPLVNAVSFTGSTEVGRHIAEKSAKYMHRLVLELGGNDAVIIFEDADVGYAVNESMIRLWNAGQTCCATKRYLVHNSIREAFVRQLAAALAGVKTGDPFAPDTRMGSMISERAAICAEKQIEAAIAQGATLVCGGTRNGAFLAPTLLDSVTSAMDLAKDEECFAPVFTVIGFDTEEEAIAIANGSVYGLNAGVISRDMNRSMRVAMRLEAGTVVANSVSQWRSNYAPFGGYKLSGVGKECLETSLDEMSQYKTIVIKGIH